MYPASNYELFEKESDQSKTWTSAVASPIRDDQGKQIGTVAITLNMEGLNILHSPYINLPDKFFYFVITGKMDVVWHS